MNFSKLQISKNLNLLQNNYKLKQPTTIYLKNYHCDEHQKNEELRNKLETDFLSIKSLNLNNKEIFLFKKFKKISEQNDKILNQNDKIVNQNNKILSILSNIHNNYSSDSELLKKYIYREQYEI